MSNTRQTGIRLPELTQRQLSALCEWSGMNQSSIVIMAIDRMHQKELGSMNTQHTVTVYWIDDCVQMINNGDGTWSVTDNGDEVDGLNYESAVSYAVEYTITDEDVDAWHNGDGMTDHLQTIIRKLPEPRVIQVWGSRTGNEPLSITVTDEIATWAQ